jgi:hypothetical protein
VELTLLPLFVSRCRIFGRLHHCQLHSPWLDTEGYQILGRPEQAYTYIGFKMGTFDKETNTVKYVSVGIDNAISYCFAFIASTMLAEGTDLNTNLSNLGTYKDTEGYQILGRPEQAYTYIGFKMGTFDKETNTPKI